MIRVSVSETMPALARRDRPAFRFIDLFRLPDIEEPAVSFIFQALNFFTKMKRPLHRAINQAFTRITAQHSRCRFN
ncbi:hypothetical protein D3C72_1781070 [compost metagenome]